MNLERMSYSSLRATILEANALTGQSDSHYILVVGPQPLDPLRSRVEIATPYLLKRLLSTQLADNREKEHTFYRQCLDDPPMRGFAAQMLEPRLHDYLRNHHIFHLRALVKQSLAWAPDVKAQKWTNDASAVAIATSIDMEHLVAFSNVKEITEFEDNTYYCPFSRHETAYDGFTWEAATKSVTVFQLTVSPEHDVKMKGITDLGEALAKQGVSEWKCRYVAMVPEGQSVAIITPLELSQDPSWSEYAFEVPDSVMNPRTPIVQR
jgi:hypothetical protein